MYYKIAYVKSYKNAKEGIEEAMQDTQNEGNNANIEQLASRVGQLDSNIREIWASVAQKIGAAMPDDIGNRQLAIFNEIFGRLTGRLEQIDQQLGQVKTATPGQAGSDTPESTSVFGGHLVRLNEKLDQISGRLGGALAAANTDSEAGATASANSELSGVSADLEALHDDISSVMSDEDVSIDDWTEDDFVGGELAHLDEGLSEIQGQIQEAVATLPVDSEGAQSQSEIRDQIASIDEQITLISDKLPTSPAGSENPDASAAQPSAVNQPALPSGHLAEIEAGLAAINNELSQIDAKVTAAAAAQTGANPGDVEGFAAINAQLNDLDAKLAGITERFMSLSEQSALAANLPDGTQANNTGNTSNVVPGAATASDDAQTVGSAPIPKAPIIPEVEEGGEGYDEDLYPPATSWMEGTGGEAAATSDSSNPQTAGVVAGSTTVEGGGDKDKDCNKPCDKPGAAGGMDPSESSASIPVSVPTPKDSL